MEIFEDDIEELEEEDFIKYNEAVLLIKRSLFESLRNEFLAIASMNLEDVTLLDLVEHVKWNDEHEIVLLEWYEIEASVRDDLESFIITLSDDDYHLLEVDEYDKEVDVGCLCFKGGMFAEIDSQRIRVRTDVKFVPMNPYNTYVSFK